MTFIPFKYDFIDEIFWLFFLLNYDFIFVTPQLYFVLISHFILKIL